MLRHAERAKVEAEPRTMQFEIQRPCPYRGERGVLPGRALEAFPFPTAVWVELHKIPKHGTIACPNPDVYRVTRLGRSQIEEITGRKLPPNDLVVCEHMGRLIE
jgi:hypothetical protein